MVQRFLETTDATCKVLLNTLKALLPLSADEIAILENLEKVLSPFEHTTVVTVSVVIPVCCGLLHSLENLKGKLATEEGQLAVASLINGIKDRLLKYESRSNTRMATVLDPRFKRDGFLPPFNVSEAEKFLENELIMVKALSELRPSSSNLPAPKPTDQHHPLFDFLQKKKSEKIRKSRVDSILGLKQYFNMDNLHWTTGRSQLTTHLKDA
ncbi:uncharacterized protein LOC116803678 isoform X1 [Drosophila mojavensis]|uniref:uncharacterized protein LOC116803678 isoform X1 n=1 Tax=Drosophila mojavensis TaxID=7230 RepID=UPI0013EE52F0|nr:uncharacterized protein LOC116803678 isoform X1 [Drosophila mojavensis]XP_043863990.1 uncharacterized protein LOC116803678 isoform X1 [Drosophila mojavensis]